MFQWPQAYAISHLCIHKGRRWTSGPPVALTASSKLSRGAPCICCQTIIIMRHSFHGFDIISFLLISIILTRRDDRLYDHSPDLAGLLKSGTNTSRRGVGYVNLGPLPNLTSFPQPKRTNQGSCENGSPPHFKLSFSLQLSLLLTSHQLRWQDHFT